MTTFVARDPAAWPNVPSAARYTGETAIFAVEDDPTFGKAWDAVSTDETADIAVVLTEDGQHVLFRAWRVSQTTYAWQRSTMAAPAFATYRRLTEV